MRAEGHSGNLSRGLERRSESALVPLVDEWREAAAVPKLGGWEAHGELRLGSDYTGLWRLY